MRGSSVDPLRRLRSGASRSGRSSVGGDAASDLMITPSTSSTTGPVRPPSGGVLPPLRPTSLLLSQGILPLEGAVRPDSPSWASTAPLPSKVQIPRTGLQGPSGGSLGSPVEGGEASQWQADGGDYQAAMRALSRQASNITLTDPLQSQQRPAISRRPQSGNKKFLTRYGLDKHNLFTP
jgi:hypothetical protein